MIKENNDFIVIDSNYSGVRLDRFLRQRFNITQGKICDFCKKKRILLNGNSVNFNDRLNTGDKLLVGLDLEKNKENNISYEIPIKILRNIEKSIIYQDKNIICINKPFDLAVQGGTGIKFSLIDCLQSLVQKQIYIVHRIDKDTSGLIVFAKNRNSAEKISTLFRERKVFKKYFAILSRKPNQNSGKIETYIDKHEKDAEFNLMQNVKKSLDKGKLSVTEYKVIGKNNDGCIVEFIPKTGRKHQLRVHAQYIKCPIVGDEKYGNDKKNKLQLFACELKIPDFCDIKIPMEEFIKNIES